MVICLTVSGFVSLSGVLALRLRKLDAIWYLSITGVLVLQFAAGMLFGLLHRSMIKQRVTQIHGYNILGGFPSRETE